MVSSSLAHLDLKEGLTAYPLLLSSMNACTLPLLPPPSPGSPNHGRNVGAELTVLSVGSACEGCFLLTHFRSRASISGHCCSTSVTLNAYMKWILSSPLLVQWPSVPCNGNKVFGEMPRFAGQWQGSRGHGVASSAS